MQLIYSKTFTKLQFFIIKYVTILYLLHILQSVYLISQGRIRASYRKFPKLIQKINFS